MVGIRPEKSILVIEDDESIRETLKMTLEFWGYRVVTACDGQVAINFLSTFPASNPSPSLILTDLMMPVKDGWAVLAHLQKDQNLSQIPVIVITAYAERAQFINATSIIRKPIDLDILEMEIQRYCPLEN